jgi:enhancing lycopene biosynthesis protein 2
MKKIAILLSGCGVYDGSEIQETVLAMLAIQEVGAEYFCISINREQYHIINHLDGSVQAGNRNMLEESARIARGNVQEIKNVEMRDFDALLIPGGFGNAKNLSNWAFQGPDGEILPEVKLFLVNCINIGKPIAALCVSPILIAKALENSGLNPHLTFGNTEDSSPYLIEEFNNHIEKIGSIAENQSLHSVAIDRNLKVVSAPCYMLDASILEIRENIKQAVEQLVSL